MKNYQLISMILLSIAPACDNKSSKNDLDGGINSYEISADSHNDTINRIINGLKQGKWVIKKNERVDTVYYKNDSLK